MKQIKVGIIGCGYISRIYITNLKKYPGVATYARIYR